MNEGTIADEADVIVVGAGPGGSAAAYHMARHGLRVVLLEKTEFPREKVCGDGLTPRATRQLIRMGVDTSEKAGWLQNRGLRVTAWCGPGWTSTTCSPSGRSRRARCCVPM